MSQPLISLSNVSVNIAGRHFFRDLDMRIEQGKHLLLTGPAGSGKTLLLELLAGRQGVSAGSRTYPLIREQLASGPEADPLTEPTHFIAYISSRHHFRNLSNTSEFYYQQRYNSIDADNAPTVKSYLESRISAAHAGSWTLGRVVDTFRLEPLLEEHLIKLSNGETKRLLLAAAMIRNPLVLLMDNPLTGLDVASRSDMNNWLGQVAASGVTIIMTGNGHELPPVIKQCLVLSNEGSVSIYSPDDIAALPGRYAQVQMPDEQVLAELLNRKPIPAFESIIGMKDVSIRYGDKLILDKINWDVRPGERWALLGPNGAGKSSLLSLVNGDNPQAYANDIVLFDRKRGSGESIWDIKKNIGFISPELFQYFPTDISCVHVIESGFYDTIGLFRPSNPSYAAICRRWMQEMRMDGLANRLFRTVSASQQRLCLLARALVKNPALLILDEPCQGLDDEQQAFFKQLIDMICAQSQVAVVYVSHYTHELPDSIRHTIRLESGRRIQ